MPADRAALTSLLTLLLRGVATHGDEAMAPHRALRGGAACISDADCNLNGVCNSNRCACDRGWTGVTCGVLDVQPVQVVDNAAYSGVIWPPTRNMSAWGGNVIPPQTAGGSFELYASEMVNHCGLSTWQKNSRIIHASASSLSGPYKMKGEVMPPFAHNANPIVIPHEPYKGHYAVFHVGFGSSMGSLSKCNNGTTPNGVGHEEPEVANSCKPVHPEPIPLKKSISVPHAESPAGPWAFETQTCVGPNLSSDVGGCPHFSNAAPLILANGTTLLLHSGCPGWQQSGLNLAIAPQWTGPFRPAKGQNAWYTPSIETISQTHPGGCTDPFFWLDPRGRYHSLFHCHWTEGDAGGHAFSNDGLRWTTSATRPWSEVITLSDGTSITYEQRQRPHLVLNNDGVAGVSPSGSPAALVTGLKIFNKNERGNEPWMQWCKGCMSPGCDQTATHLQPISRDSTVTV